MEAEKESDYRMVEGKQVVCKVEGKERKWMPGEEWRNLTEGERKGEGMTKDGKANCKGGRKEWMDESRLREGDWV